MRKDLAAETVTKECEIAALVCSWKTIIRIETKDINVTQDESPLRCEQWLPILDGPIWEESSANSWMIWPDNVFERNGHGNSGRRVRWDKMYLGHHKQGNRARDGERSIQ
jgi:hypothetical protein